MSLEVPRGRPGKETASTDLAEENLATAADIAPAYVVVVSPYGNPRRRVYLSLNHAAAAVARARGKGRSCWMVLCELRPVVADLDPDGEVTE
jgi:hypothetical protein